MENIDKTCREFTELLGSADPVPGGGGAAALAGALGAALCMMVGSLTTGKKAYANVEMEIQRLLSESSALRRKLLKCVEADAEGFMPLAKAYRMKKDNPAREEALQKASETACEAPFEIMNLSLRGLMVANRLADVGTRTALSDTGCAAALLGGALRAAAMNVFANTRTMTDVKAAKRLNRQCDALLKQGAALSNAVYDRVYRQMAEM